MEIHVTYVNAHLRVSTSQEDFSNQLDRICLLIPVSLFPQPPVIA